MAKLPPLFENGVDPAQKILSVTAFFARAPKSRTSLLAAVPPPLHARWEPTAIFACTEEWPDADVARTYSRRRNDDDEASDADWAKFFRAVGTWLGACADAGALFAVISAPIATAGYAAAAKRGTAEVFELIVPHLTKLLAGRIGDGILIGNLAFGIALRLRGGALSDEDRLALIRLGEAAIESSANGEGVWQELFEDILPAKRNRSR